MSDVPEPDYDEQEEVKQTAPVPPPAESPVSNTTASAASSAPIDAAESLRQQVAAQITGHDEASKTLTEDEKKEVDSRSVHVAGVDYSVTNADLQHLFEKCGDIVRAKVMTDKTGKPKGFAYIEFAHIDSVARALELTDTVLKSRKLTVTQKRTNVPGMKRPAPGAGGRGGFVGFMPMPYGMAPGRGRGGPFRGYSQRGRGRTGPY